jgi:hypothetical protein
VTFVHWDDVEAFDVPDKVEPLGGAGSGSPTRRAACASARRTFTARRRRSFTRSAARRRSGRAARRLGLIARLEPLDYFDGEPS